MNLVPFRIMLQLATSLSQNGWLIYSLGLAAAGLLPIRTRRAYWGVSLALCLLWGLLTLRAAGESSWWATLALLEFGWFLGLGVLGRRLAFTARNGPWTVIGTCLIVYSLFVLPVLGYFFETFRGSAFGAPFPLVLFTCGILFFAAAWTTNLILVIPILWALFGGPSGDLIEVVGLQVALLTSIFFFLLPPQLRGGSDRRSPGSSYSFAYQRRAIFGYGLWALVLASAFLIFFTLATKDKQGWTEILPVVTTNVALLAVLGIALWLEFPAWQSLWYRYSAWCLARIAGRIWVWLQGSWRWGVFLLAAAVLILMLPSKKDQAAGGSGTGSRTAEQTQGSQDGAGGQKNGNAIETLLGKINPLARDIPLGVLVATVLVWLSYQAYQGRKRLVIGTFVDYTGDDKSEKWVPGLGTRLQNELTRIADLFRVIDETYPSRKASLIEVTPNVQDVGEILKDASAITLGSLQIRSNFLAGIAGSLVSGRRLTGALHKVGNEYVLTAELGGGKPARSWRVDFKKLSEEERRLEGEAAVDRLVEQLAFRVATDLVPIGSPRWLAVRCYIDGLRAQRETQRRQGDKNATLREAERSFIQALNDDQRFTQCHYNLGVVYRQLGELGSAEAAFRRALKEEPDNFEACYALALTAAESGKPGEAVWFCKAAIEIDSADPRPWDLEAFARRQDEETREGSGSPLPPAHRAWNDIQERSEIAGALAWRALCRQLVRGSAMALQTPEQANAYLCVRNLAVVLTRSGRQERSEQVFRQAAWIAPHDPNPRLYEGRTLFWNQRESAMAALEGVFDDGLVEVADRGLLWALSAQLHSHSADAEDSRNARFAVRRFLDLAATMEEQDLKKLLDFSLEEPPQGEPSEASK